MTTIEDILRKNGVNFQPIDISHISFLMSLSLPDKVKNYLQCMGTTIKYHETNWGFSSTTHASLGCSIFRLSWQGPVLYRRWMVLCSPGKFHSPACRPSYCQAIHRDHSNPNGCGNFGAQPSPALSLRPVPTWSLMVMQRTPNTGNRSSMYSPVWSWLRPSRHRSW